MAKTLSGLTPEREQRITELLLIRNSRTAEARFKSEISRAMVGFGDAYGDDIKTAEVDRKHREAVLSLLRQIYSQAFNQFGRRMLNGFKKYDPRESVKALDVYEQAFRRYLIVFGATKVGQIAGTTQEQAQTIITNSVNQGLEDGLGEAEIAALITAEVKKQAGVISSFRAKTIARTESHSAAMTSNQVAAQSTGLDLKKQWVSSRGERTRPDHREANGQVVGMDENFIVGGEPLFIPGDPSGSAAQIINCRCVQTYVLPDN